MKGEKMMIGKFAAAQMSLFGYGARKELSAFLNREGVKKALIVTDTVLEQLGICEKICEVLRQSEINYIVYNGVMSNPTLTNVEDGVKAYQKNECDFIVAIGGGSSNDCAKAIRIMVANGGELKDYQGGNKSKRKGPMLVAVNTTAGTASEVSRAYLISDVKEKKKLIFKDDYAMPTIAVNDTDLMLELPSSITAQTGMDALTHAIESFCSKTSFLLSNILAADAMRLIYQYLPIAVQEPQNIEARDAMAYGQYLAGLSFGNAGLGIVHAMAHQLGGTYNLPHGLCNAVLLPVVMEFNKTACKEELVKIAEILKPESCLNKSEEEKAEFAVHLVRELSKQVKTDQKLKELKVQESDFAIMADKALQDGCILSSQVIPTKEQIVELYKKVW